MEKANNTELIAHKVYRVIEMLGGDSIILSIIGSWGDTLTDEEVIDHLDSWIKAGGKEYLRVIQSVQ